MSIFIKFIITICLLPLIITAGETEMRAAIDFGSGAIKLHLAEVDIQEQRVVRSLLSKQTSVKLTEDVAANGNQISPAMIEQIRSVLLAFMDEVNSINDQVRYTGVATAVFRKAHNGAAVLKQLEQEFGLPLVILSQEEEGKLGLSTARALFPQVSEEELIAWDNGNGSFQMTRCVEGDYQNYQGPTGFGVIRILLSRDIRKGAVLKPQESGNPVGKEESLELICKIQALLPSIPEWLRDQLHSEKICIATFGEGNSLFPVMAQSLAVGATGPVDEAIISLDDLKGLCTAFENREDAHFDSKGIYRNTYLGALYLVAVMEMLEIDTIYYKRSLGNTPGILIEPQLWK